MDIIAASAAALFVGIFIGALAMKKIMDKIDEHHEIIRRLYHVGHK